jgi:hypothetical protein
VTARDAVTGKLARFDLLSGTKDGILAKMRAGVRNSRANHVAKITVAVFTIYKVGCVAIATPAKVIGADFKTMVHQNPHTNLKPVKMPSFNFSGGVVVKMLAGAEVFRRNITRNSETSGL